MWLKKNWPAVLAILLQGESLWKLIRWALDWRGRYDALVETYHEIGGTHAMIGYLLEPSPWFYPLAFVVGVALMWWNFHRNRATGNREPTSVAPAIGTVSQIESVPTTNKSERPDPIVEPDRMPILELRRLAADAGWDINPRTSDDAFHLTNRLNQAAVDGIIKLWGRKHDADRTETGVQAVPLIEIPSTHFIEYRLSQMNLFGEEAKNYLIFTGQVGKQPRELRGQIFQDVHADRGQLIAWINRNRRDAG